MITGRQISAARALLGMRQDELSSKSGVPLGTLKRMESKGTERSAAASVDSLKTTLEREGVKFLADGGVSPPATAKTNEPWPGFQAQAVAAFSSNPTLQKDFRGDFSTYYSYAKAVGEGRHQDPDLLEQIRKQPK